ncbi:MAG: glycosyltransferase family 4 protein [Ruminococcaceae bacterium]|nr:glycosyltransferase family 4 protein [Oscillospiraceae bacterium]
MNKKIWVINHNAQPPSLGGLCRHYYFKKYSKDTEYDIRIITSSVIHNTKINMIEDPGQFLAIKEVDGEEFVFLNSNTYEGNSFKRKLNFLSFAWKLKKLPKKLHEKPDVIYTSSPDIFAAFYAIKLARKLKVPCVLEIRDLWPESIIEYNGFSKNHPLIQIMYKMEKWMYKHASSIVFTTEGERQYILDRGWEKKIDLNKCYYINNGVDFSALEAKREAHIFEDPILHNTDTVKCAYVGSIRKANSVQMIADAAKILKDNQNIEFLFFGDGTEKASIERFCKENQLNNCHFYGKVDSLYIPYICKQADINILNYQQAKTLKYGGSQNKLFDYLSSGTPIISTVQMNYNLVDRAKCGITLVEHTAEELAKKIEYLAGLAPEERAAMGENGIETAKEFDYRVLTERFLFVIEKTLYGQSKRNYKVYEGEKING